MTLAHNPLAPRINRLGEKSATIKSWVRQLADLPADTPITVAELACRDEGCPDIETVIGVLEPGKPIRTLRVHLPMDEVMQADIASAIAEDE